MRIIISLLGIAVLLTPPLVCAQGSSYVDPSLASNLHSDLISARAADEGTASGLQYMQAVAAMNYVSGVADALDDSVTCIPLGMV